MCAFIQLIVNTKTNIEKDSMPKTQTSYKKMALVDLNMYRKAVFQETCE